MACSTSRSLCLGPLWALCRLSALAGVLVAGVADAQTVDRRYVAEPTDGMTLPATALAGEHDGRALLVNPGGLGLVRGPEVLLALQYEDPDRADAPGAGGGLLLTGPLGGGLLPRVGLGLGVEVLRPSRGALTPDPGTPVRTSLGAALPIGSSAAVGAAWRHFFDDGGLDGLDTLDLGASVRLGNRWAAGATLRDALAPRAVGRRVERRYQAELALRPTGSDVVDLGLGAAVREDDGAVDAWARAQLRLVRGVYAHLGASTGQVSVVSTSGAQVTRSDGRDMRVSVGLELSLGAMGVTTWASGVRDEGGASHPLGVGVMVRSSAVEVPSMLSPDDHIERVELSGALDGEALVGLVLRLRAIGRDRSARAVALVFEDLTAGWAALRELRQELAALRARGTKVYAFLVTGDTRDYYLASVADKVYVDPAGGLSLTGVSSVTTYWRGAFDLVGVSPQFEKIAEYKSAPEAFTRSGPTAPAAAMRAELLDGTWAEVRDAIAGSRGLTPQRVQALVDDGPYTGGDLAQLPALVDGVATPERAAVAIIADLGQAMGVAEPPVERPRQWRRPRIALVHVQGDIVDGVSQTIPLLRRRMVGGQTIAAAIAAARESADVGAIVLRIDSPGGSALASEQIAREVFATRGVKPIVCSLGNVAASGGYFAAAGCELIFAESTTVTGSIGIFYGKFDLGGLLARLGVTTVTDKRGRRADLESMARPYSDEERQVLRDKLRYAYSRFVGAVAEGRGLSRERVDELGRGRVWTGARAKELGLVDRIGGVGDALEEARRRLGLDPGASIEVVQLPRGDGGLLSTVRRLIGGAEQADQTGLASIPAALLTQELSAVLDGLWPSLLLSPGAAQARLPFAWD